MSESTIDDHVRTAKTILARGPDGVNSLWMTFTSDIYTAYALLQRFVAEIERLREQRTADWADFRENAVARLALIDEQAAEIARLRDQLAVAEAEADAMAHMRVENERLRALVDAVGEQVCEVALRMKVRYGGGAAATQSTDDSMRNTCRHCGRYHDGPCE